MPTVERRLVEQLYTTYYSILRDHPTQYMADVVDGLRLALDHWDFDPLTTLSDVIFSSEGSPLGYKGAFDIVYSILYPDARGERIADYI